MPTVRNIVFLIPSGKGENRDSKDQALVVGQCGPASHSLQIRLLLLPVKTFAVKLIDRKGSIGH